MILGMLGGGQLGRMAALVAAKMGIQTHVYSPGDKDEPAKQVTNLATNADYDDKDALLSFAQSVDAISYEFENVPLTTAEFLSEYKPVFPRPNVLKVAQDRILEKGFLKNNGFATAPFLAMEKEDDFAQDTAQTFSYPGVLKTARMGYDGKGQAKVKNLDEAKITWKTFRSVPCVLEGFVEFEKEASIIIARGQKGDALTYPAVVNVHQNHILKTTFSVDKNEGYLSPQTRKTMNDMAHAVAEKLDLVGVLAIECFVLANGDVLINELAPRPHNSGHWTMDGCKTCQFEQQVRAVMGLPLGDVHPIYPITMENLIGDDIAQVEKLWQDKTAHIHLYGKTETRPGRKMGHVNFITD